VGMKKEKFGNDEYLFCLSRASGKPKKAGQKSIDSHLRGNDKGVRILNFIY